VWRAGQSTLSAQITGLHFGGGCRSYATLGNRNISSLVSLNRTALSETRRQARDGPAIGQGSGRN
jgi:hypothetical protein